MAIGRKSLEHYVGKRNLLINVNNNGSKVKVKGREAQTLINLIVNGSNGVTQLQATRKGAGTRLSAYIFNLRQLGITIETKRSYVAGITFGIYVLTEPQNLKILDVYEC